MSLRARTRTAWSSATSPRPSLQTSTVESLDHAGWTALNDWKDVYEAGGGDVLIEQAEHLWTEEDHQEHKAKQDAARAVRAAEREADSGPLEPVSVGGRSPLSRPVMVGSASE